MRNESERRPIWLKFIHDPATKTIMKLKELMTIEQLEQFLNGTQAVIFEINLVKKGRYDWMRRELVRFNYLQLGKVDKGVVIRYLMKVSGYSRQQVTRLIAQYRKTGYIKHHHVNAPAFQTRYCKGDIRLLAKMDQRHDVPGQALKKLCERAYRVFDEAQIERLSTISVSHLYNLRKTKTYGLTRQHFQKTQAKASKDSIQGQVLLLAELFSIKTIRYLFSNQCLSLKFFILCCWSTRSLSRNWAVVRES